MNKTINVSISGILFTLEEEAARVINKYLEKLFEHCKSNSCGQEIMEGIESRISELLVERGYKSAVVPSQVAQEVLDVIGAPEDIFDPSQDGTSSAPCLNDRSRRRFFRNPEGKMVGGVCSGIGAYFDIDPIWLRLAFVLVCLGGFAIRGWWGFGPLFALLVYVILWILMPLAATPSQIIEMRGGRLSGNVQTPTSESGLSRVLGIIGRIILIFAGCILFIIGFSGLCASACVILGLGVAAMGIAGFALPAVITEIASALGTVPCWAVIVIKVLSALVVFIPFLALLYGGVKMLFRFKTPKWKPGIVMLITWLASLVALLIISIAAIPDIWTTLTQFSELTI